MSVVSERQHQKLMDQLATQESITAAFANEFGAMLDESLRTVEMRSFEDGESRGYEDGADDSRNSQCSAVASSMQDIFDKHGPERDRRTDWLRCTEEPWYSLAGLFRGGV